ncbi:MAG TPA: class I SAM-dependent methyltransferase [Herpetosiphonaceae bacterium]|nr:class I SAM-dependent methyltransferase [Herpetosiphonaceae bacterium]
MRLELLYCDDDLVAVNKPAGLPTHAPQDDPALADVVSLLKAQLGGDYLGVHQRLDRDTSGVLLFARRPAANAALAAAFAGRSVSKRYLALVHGTPDRRSGTISAALAPAKNGLMQVAGLNDRRAQEAATDYAVLAHTPDRRLALLELRPHTGRTHQIRVHLLHIGHPVVGDPLYDAGRPAPRLMLHAQELRLAHPNGGDLAIAAPPPALFGRAAQGLPELDDRSGEAAAAGLVELAAERRAPLSADPATSIYRVFHGPGDGATNAILREWTVDRAGDVLIASCYDERVRQLPAELREALARTWQPRAIYAKYRPRTAAQVGEAELAELAPVAPAWGAAAGEVDGQEEGLWFRVRPADGLSVGLYADMRETRQRVRRWAAGRELRVLNTFAYTCAFGVAALADAPQAQVTNLDLSRRSLDWGRENYALNGLAAGERDFVFGDVFDWLGRWVRQGRRFDLVILDPPSFARNRGKRWRAERDYAELAELAARLIAPDGMLVACCNHAGLDRRAFRAEVERGIAASGWPGAITAGFGASPIDYPTAGGAESHLKIILAQEGGR